MLGAHELMNYQKNKEDRHWMLRFWANYIKTHTDKEWSSQQAILIDSIVENLLEKVKNQ